MARESLPSTQQFLPFADVREGVVIMKDGSFRAVAMTSAVNFALKSEQEQNAIIYQYQNFLNSLTFPIEIVMQSKRLDLTSYLKQLQALEERESNELLRLLIEDYRVFVGKLITVANIMDKRFYITLPYQNVGVKSETEGLVHSSHPRGPIQISETQFSVAREELKQRLLTIQSGLNAIGLQVVALNTQQLVELLYATYNPEEAEAEKLDAVEQLQGGVVEQAPQPPGTPPTVQTAQTTLERNPTPDVVTPLGVTPPTGTPKTPPAAASAGAHEPMPVPKSPQAPPSPPPKEESKAPAAEPTPPPISTEEGPPAQPIPPISEHDDPLVTLEEIDTRGGK